MKLCRERIHMLRSEANTQLKQPAGTFHTPNKKRDNFQISTHVLQLLIRSFFFIEYEDRRRICVKRREELFCHILCAAGTRV